MSRRRKIIKPEKNIIANIAFIIPTTSNKRNYKTPSDMDFFKILYASFLKTCARGDIKYSFYLGYDDDDQFYKNNIESIKTYFNSFNNQDTLHLIEIKNLKNKVGQIWTQLANIASLENEYLYQTGDDIAMLNSGWEKKFISYLEKVNFVGAVGPQDINNPFIITQSFVHINHLKLFGYYFPQEIDNWYVDDWINNVYPAKRIMEIKVSNIGGCPRYNICDNKNNYLKILERDKKKLNIK